MSSSRTPFAGPMPHAGTHGGVKSIHRFGTDGGWSHARTEDARLVAEMIYTGRKAVADFYCADCDSIITLLRTPPAAGPGQSASASRTRRATRGC